MSRTLRHPKGRSWSRSSPQRPRLGPGHKRGAGKAVGAPPTSRCSSPVKDGPDSRTVGTVPVDVEACGQEDPVFDRDGSVGEGGDQQLVPTWGKAGGGVCGEVSQSLARGGHCAPELHFRKKLIILALGQNESE